MGSSKGGWKKKKQTGGGGRKDGFPKRELSRGVLGVEGHNAAGGASKPLRGGMFQWGKESKKRHSIKGRKKLCFARFLEAWWCDLQTRDSG